MALQAHAHLSRKLSALRSLIAPAIVSRAFPATSSEAITSTEWYAKFSFLVQRRV